MKTTIRIFGMALVLLVAILLIGCSNDDDMYSPPVNTTSYKAPPAPTGRTEQTFNEGATLADVAVNGENIKWYSYNPKTYYPSNNYDLNKVENQGEYVNQNPALPMSSPLENSKIYYATQTVNGIESGRALAVITYLIPNSN